jgi:hypothetical protein
MGDDFKKKKARSVKSFFWRNNDSKSAKHKKMVSKSIQLFKSQRQAKDHENGLL